MCIRFGLNDQTQDSIDGKMNWHGWLTHQALCECAFMCVCVCACGYVCAYMNVFVHVS